MKIVPWSRSAACINCDEVGDAVMVHTSCEVSLHSCLRQAAQSLVSGTERNWSVFCKGGASVSAQTRAGQQEPGGRTANCHLPLQDGPT